MMRGPVDVGSVCVMVTTSRDPRVKGQQAWKTATDDPMTR